MAQPFRWLLIALLAYAWACTGVALAQEPIPHGGTGGNEFEFFCDRDGAIPGGVLVGFRVRAGTQIDQIQPVVPR